MPRWTEAAHHWPAAFAPARVLLLDEPTENLDADERARLIGVIANYARDHVHGDRPVTTWRSCAVADRILVLEDGRITQVGDIELLAVDRSLREVVQAQHAVAG